MEILKVAFIFAAFLSLGSGLAITSESFPWNTISNDLLEELIPDEKNSERNVQIEGSHALRLTEEKNLAGGKTLQNSIHDVSNKATEKLFGTAVDVATLPEATTRGLKRRIDWEPSCTKSSEIRVLPKSSTQVRSATECYLTASLHGKCMSSIIPYGRRACQKAYVEMEGLAIAFCRCAKRNGFTGEN